MNLTSSQMLRPSLLLPQVKGARKHQLLGFRGRVKVLCCEEHDIKVLFYIVCLFISVSFWPEAGNTSLPPCNGEYGDPQGIRTTIKHDSAESD